MGAPVRVIVVDDHPIIRRGLIMMIALEDDIEIIGEAKDGLEAISLARSLKPDVILIDLDMPQLNGVEAIKEILARQPDIKAIILTSHDDDDHIFEGLAAGAKGYLLKKAPPEQLLEAIRAAARDESLLSPGVAARLVEQFSNLAKQPPPDEPAPPPPPANLPKLTAREKEVLYWLAQGARNQDIAEQLTIVEPTVKIHVSNIFNKLGVNNRTEATAVAMKLGLVGDMN